MTDKQSSLCQRGFTLRIVVSLVVILSAFFVLSCGGGDTSAPASAPAPQPTPTPVPLPTLAPTQGSDKAVLLERTSQTLANAFVNREWILMHSLYPDEFRAKCSSTDFAGVMTFFWSFLGVPEDITAVVDDLRVDGNKAWVDIRFEKDGVEIEIGEDSAEDEPAFVWEDGQWVIYVLPEDLAEEDPCSLDFGSVSEPTPVSTPASEPTPAATQPSPPPEPINIYGSGTTVESISLLSEGIWIVALSVNGNEDCSVGTCSEDNFIVTIESVDGSSTEFPANEIAKDWSAEVTVSVGGLFGLPVGKQVVSVDASGDWNISFNLALPEASPDDPDAPVSLVGSGTAVESISLSEGLWIVALDVSDNEDCSLGFCSEDNFIITIESVDGSSTEFPANEIAKDWSGEVTVTVGGLFGLADGTQLVSVDASGDWTITFTKA